MYCINYVIKKGDTLYNISRRNNVSISAIMEANPLVNVYNLMVDETLCIPVSVPSNNYTSFTTYLVQEGDTLGNVMERSEVNLADLMQLNSLNDIYLLPGSTMKIPVVDEGESKISL